MKKTLEKDEDLDLALLAYRNTPVLNSYRPSQLLMSRYLRDNLPIIDKNLEPNLINAKLFNQKIGKNSYNTAKQYSQKGVQDLSELPIGTIVRYQEIPKGSWKLGKIIEKVRYRTYKIVKGKGKYIIRNRRFIKETKEDVNKNMYSPEPNTSTFVYNGDLSNSNSLNQQSENEIVKITNEQSENENVQTE
jgi:hypothetical protein